MNWIDAGYKLWLSVSTDGDIVSLGNRTDYPFTPNGSAAAPLGWTAYLANGGLLTHVNWTTQDGRFSISNVGQSNSHAGSWYGIYRDFPVTAGNRYIIQFQTRVMQDKTRAWRLLRWQLNGAGPQTGAHAPAQDDWEQMSYPITVAAGTTFLRLYLIAYPYWEDPTNETTDWGIQFQNFAIIEMQPTYPDPTFRDVSCDVNQLTTRYGRSHYTSRFDVAAASVGIVNNDGEWVYSSAHPWGLRPGRFVMVEITEPNSSTRYPMFYGLIDKITDGFTRDGRSMAILECVDNSSLLSNWNVPSSTDIQESHQSGNRIRRLAESAGWLTQLMQLEDGVFYQQAILANGRTVRDEMGLCADSEGGYFFCDRNGKLRYYDRNGPSTVRTWGYVQAELLAECVPRSGLPIVDAVPDETTKPIIDLQSLDTDWDRSRVINDIQLANQGGSAFQLTDDISKRKYGPRTHQRMDFLNANTRPDYMNLRLHDYIDGWTEAMLRVNRVSWRPNVYDKPESLWAIKAFLNDLVRIRYEHPTELWGFAVVPHIQSIAHSFTLDDWEIVLEVDQPLSFAEWDSAQPGYGWDDAIWDTNLWDAKGP